MFKRYIFSFGSNFIRAALAFVSTLFTARLLGPNDYGRFAFLLAAFLAVKQFTDLGASQAFFFFMSRKIRSRKFILSYFIWLFFQFIVSILFIIIVIPESYVTKIWNNESTDLIILALFASFMQTTLWPAVQQALDSQRKNYLSQGVSAMIALGHLIVIYFLYRYDFFGIYENNGQVELHINEGEKL